MVVVISNNDCRNCTRTIAHLKAKQVPYIEYMHTNDAIMNVFGHLVKSFPTVVVLDNDTVKYWVGYSKINLDALPDNS